MACGPAFGGAVFCTRTEGENGFVGVQSVFGKRGGAAFGGNGETRVIGMSVEVRLRRVGEGGVAVDHQGQGGFVEFADVVEQQIARFADVAGALLDAGGESDEGGFERTGQDDDLVVTLFAQFASDAPAFFQLQRAVSERVFNNAADFGHTLEHRHRPFGRECVYGAAGMEFVQAAVKRLGHDAVADPARGDDEDFFGHGGVVGLVSPYFNMDSKGRLKHFQTAFAYGSPASNRLRHAYSSPPANTARPTAAQYASA